MRPPAEQLIRDYMNRLSIATRNSLQPDDRRAFLARTRDYIERQAGGRENADPAVVLRILVSLGEPEAAVEREAARLLANRRERASADPRRRTPLNDEELLKDIQLPAQQLSQPLQRIDIGRCRITGIREQATLETLLSEERKTYPNSSKNATLTKEIGVSNSIARTVTIEASKLRAHNAQAGITLLGFASIQGQVQQQLNQRYSVTAENSITVSEKTTIQIPPNSTVEHVIQWKVVILNGLAILGETPRFSQSFDLAEVPYHLALRLTYTESLHDVPLNR
jgi:hypothetical protein